MTEETASTQPSTAGTGIPQPETPPAKKRSLLWLWITLSVLVVLGVAGVMTYNYYFHAQIRPTVLSEQEREVLNTKIETIESAGASAMAAPETAMLAEDDGYLVEMNQVRLLPPEEQEAILREQERDRRTLVLTEKEINGMLNYNTDLGERLKFEFKPGYIDINYVQPIDDDVMMVGGKTLRLSVDFSLKKMPGGKLELTVRDVNVAGVPLPTAWLDMVGIPKGQNLVEAWEDEYPWFEQFMAGIEYIDVSSGVVSLRLAE